MKLIKVMDLIGKPVAGVRCDTRTRNPNGELCYPEQEMESRMRILTVAERRNEKGWNWYYLRWRPVGFSNHAGMREDCEHLKTWHVMIEDTQQRKDLWDTKLS